MYKIEKSIKNIIKYQYNNKSTNPVHIGYGVDCNFARCTATSITSFCINNETQNFVFHIIADNFSDDVKQKFALLAKNYNIDIIIYDLDNSYLKALKLPVKTQWPISTYYRFIFPFILKDVNKFFYIDADIICLNNAEDLFNVDLENNIIGAVRGSDWGNKYRNEALNLKNHIYFNAGMVVMDIQKWNAFNVFDKIIKAISRNPDLFELLDQDALNLVLTGQIKYLSAEYNWFNHLNTDLTKFNKKDIVILHFTASPKPWHLSWYVSPICNSFNRDLYKSFEDKTPWKDTPLIPPKSAEEIKTYTKKLIKHGNFLQAFKWGLVWLKKKV